MKRVDLSVIPSGSCWSRRISAKRFSSYAPILRLHHVESVLYIGVSNDLDNRVGQHQEGANPGFTQRYHLKRLVYFEAYDKIADAIAREKQLKGWRRSKKIALIESLNPRWSDLSRG
jgi:putative endonuclease